MERLCRDAYSTGNVASSVKFDPANEPWSAIGFRQGTGGLADPKDAGVGPEGLWLGFGFGGMGDCTNSLTPTPPRSIVRAFTEQ